MGRAKIAMKIIENKKHRKKTYQKRKQNLIKKAHELSILCNVPICTIIYDQQTSQLPEVFSFKGGDDHQDPNITTRDPNSAQEIIARYLAYPKEGKNKRTLSLCGMLEEKIKKGEQDLLKLRQKNVMSQFSGEQLVELLVLLDQKIQFVEQKIGIIKQQGANYLDYYSNCHVDQPKPISSVMVPRININADDQLALNHDQVYQWVPSDRIQPMGADHHGHGDTNNNFEYKMNVMDGCIYYDQGLGFVNNVPVATSYSYGPNAGLLDSKPLQLPSGHCNKQQ